MGVAALLKPFDERNPQISSCVACPLPVVACDYLICVTFSGQGLFLHRLVKHIAQLANQIHLYYYKKKRKLQNVLQSEQTTQK